MTALTSLTSITSALKVELTFMSQNLKVNEGLADLHAGNVATR